MPYPPAAQATDATDATATPTTHAGRHNAVASAVNDVLAELGADPAGASADVAARLAAADAAVGGKETPAGAQAKVDTHAAAADPHPTYETAAEAQAKADAAQAFAAQRANHTGTQAQSTVTSLVTDLAAMATLSNTAPIAVGTAAAGTGNAAARDDHVHPTTGLVKTSGTQTITGPTTLLASAAGDVPLVAKGMAGQTANLQQWQNSGGTALAFLDSQGKFVTGSGLQSSGALLTTQWDRPDGAASYVDLTTTGVKISNRSTAHVNLTIKAAASQTANRQEWQDSAGAIDSRINKVGRFVTKVGTAPILADLADGEMGFSTDASGNLIVTSRVSGVLKTAIVIVA